MSVRFKVIATGAVFLVLTLFLYVTMRFKYVEEEQIGTLIVTTNSIVGDYRAMEKRLEGAHRTPTSDDLSAFLKFTHRKYGQVALLAITDKSLTVRLSSKNDRFIRSADLFEAILKDFTQDKFNITRNNPYAVRYYDEKAGKSFEQVKFYIFINKLGGYRFLVVYPYTFGGAVLTRSALEIALIVVCIVIATAAVYIALTKKEPPPSVDTMHTIDLSGAGRSAVHQDSAAARDTTNIVSDSLGGYVHGVFTKIRSTFGTGSISLYVYHPSGKLIKTMELAGNTFLRIDSISFDTIDVDNEAGRELRDGATMVLEESRKIVVPLVFNNSFLGAVNIEKEEGLQGPEIRDIRNALEGIVKNIHDYIIVNDVMTDAGTGIHSKMYFNLKYHECVKSWQSKGRDFSLMVVSLFGENEQIDDNGKNSIIKLLSPSITGIIKNDGYLCRHDDLLAILLPDMNSRKAQAVAREVQAALAKYRIRINDATILQVKPLLAASSADAAGSGDDVLALAMRRLADLS